MPLALKERTQYAGMAELADALDSGSNGRKAVQVQVLLPAPKSTAPIIKSELFFFYQTGLEPQDLSVKKTIQRIVFSSNVRGGY